MASRAEWALCLELAKRGPSLNILRYSSFPVLRPGLRSGPVPQPRPESIRARVWQQSADHDRATVWQRRWLYSCRVPGCSHGGGWGAYSPISTPAGASDAARAHLRTHLLELT